MRLTSALANMYSGSYRKRPRSAGNDSLSDELVKILREDGIDHAQAGHTLASSDLTDTRIPRRDLTGSNVHDVADVELDRRFSGVEFRSFAVVPSVRLALDTSH